jgi:hypothetical protein
MEVESAVIVYLWTTVARETPVPYSSLGVSDNDERARTAAEQYLRSGQAEQAFVEAARTAMAVHSLTPCYLRTGLGWRATADPAGEVTWAMYAEPDRGKREVFALCGSRRTRVRRDGDRTDRSALRVTG